MKKYLLDVISKNSPGLYVCELPTGYGKTYTSAQVMYEAAKNLPEGKKSFI